MAKLMVEVVTGDRVVYREDEVDMVVAPGADGMLGILPRHAPIISLLAMGEMRVVKDRQEEPLTIFGGFLEVAHDTVRVLADTAELAEEIDIARAEAARQRAETRLSQRTGDIELARAELALRRALIRLKVGRRAHGRARTGVTA